MAAKPPQTGQVLFDASASGTAARVGRPVKVDREEMAQRLLVVEQFMRQGVRKTKIRQLMQHDAQLGWFLSNRQAHRYIAKVIDQWVTAEPTETLAERRCAIREKCNEVYERALDEGKLNAAASALRLRGEIDGVIGAGRVERVVNVNVGGASHMHQHLHVAAPAAMPAEQYSDEELAAIEAFHEARERRLNAPLMIAPKNS